MECIAHCDHILASPAGRAANCPGVIALWGPAPHLLRQVTKALTGLTTNERADKSGSLGNRPYVARILAPRRSGRSRGWNNRRARDRIVARGLTGPLVGLWLSGTEPSLLAPTMPVVNASERPRRWWHSPLAVQIVGTVIGGLILFVIVGLVGLVSDLSFGEVLLYVGVPVLVVTVVAVGVLALRRAARLARGWAAWQRNAAVLIGELSAQVRRLHLADVIHSAQVAGWTVTDHGDALLFVSPDDDEMTVYGLAPRPGKVAEDLENLAPHHFDAKSIPFIANVGGDAAVGRTIAERLERETIPELERRMINLVGWAAVADLAAEAKANKWEVHWAEDGVRLLRGKDMVTVTYAEEIDMPRLRKALGLKTIRF